jgi:hypothetical protein
VLALARDRRHVITTHMREVGGPELVALPLDGGAPTPLLAGDLTPTAGLSLSDADSRAAVWSTCQATVGIAHVDAAGDVDDYLRHLTWDDSAARAIPGSDRLLVTSTRNGPRALWKVDPSGAATAEPVPLPDGVVPTLLAVAPDGTHAAFVGEKGGLYDVPLDGSGPVRAFASGAFPNGISVDREHRVLCSRTLAKGGAELVSFDAATGAEEVLNVPSYASWPEASPMDDRIVYVGRGARQLKLYVLHRSTGKANVLCPALDEAELNSPVFAADGRRLAVALGAGTVLEIDTLTCAVVRKIGCGSGAQVEQLLYAPNGELLIVRDKFTGDVWMAERTGL